MLCAFRIFGGGVNKTMMVEYQENDTVRSVLVKVIEKLCVLQDPDDAKMIFCGNTLPHDHILSDYNPQKETIVHVVFPLKSCSCDNNSKKDQKEKGDDKDERKNDFSSVVSHSNGIGDRSYVDVDTDNAVLSILSRLEEN